MKHAAQSDVRNQIVEAVRRDLVGPQSDDEVLTDAPFATYVSGVLYPASENGAAVSPGPEAEVDQDDDGGEATYTDPPVALANIRYPSSLGVTFAVDTSVAHELRVGVDTARYEPIPAEQDPRWRRIPLRFESTLTIGDIATGDEVELERGLHLFHRVRDVDENGLAAVTVMVVNRRKAPPFERDADCYFQTRMSIDAPAGPVFCERRSSGVVVGDEDLQSYALIYRDVRGYAVGHGTAVEWDSATEDRASEIRTVSVPAHELQLTDSNPDIATDGLVMRSLARDDRLDVTATLGRLTDDYAGWIDERESEAIDLHAELRATAWSHLEDCRLALARMRSGVDRLATDDDAWNAFRLANEAMFLQRARGRWIANGRPQDGLDEDDAAGEHRWRPFQIAYILLNLDGIADPQHGDRELLDLLWFPTGGGKTEAYLGLIAFTVMLRRLRRGDNGRGVTVIMRYTLRLLTIQQFERAAALITALEVVRRRTADVGDEPVSIGLWVGKDGTPATLRDTRAVLDKLRANVDVEKGSPVQVRACPWCGQKLDHRAYWIAKVNPRLVISCRDKTCEFSSGLPIHVVDEDLYRERPSLVIATADKFATLPWVKQAHTLFAADDDDVPPPELIVQDELHLISGPLGTLAGLYEAAIDMLCTRNGIRPKIIASTATIRRADRQSRALFDRTMKQFPPPGLDAGDSFFATTADPAKKPSRLYVGAMAPGTSQSTLMIRVYAAVMQQVQDVPAEVADRDPYWTLVGYFNSLRVLGGARIQITDDVRERIALLAQGGRPRELSRDIELTSREPSSAIPGHLAALARELPDEDALDYVLATNMISVGVDVDRLGLMAVMGQPQTTAEYIQATSRVGRAHPGLVLTLYNAGRSRDRSHYESFATYHSELYRQVESTSVTPFSPRARDRALHAVLIALARTAVPALRDNAAAADVEDHLPALRGFADRLSARAERVEHGSGEAVRRELEVVIERWIARSREAPRLVYAHPYDRVNALLASADEAEGEGLPTPSSLRDVDRESHLYLVRI